MEIERWTAFTTTPTGGNPAGVAFVDGGEHPSPDRMQQVAAEIGFSETAFLVPRARDRLDVRYFSPATEVAFCGHATIAAGAALLRRDPDLTGVVLSTAVGDVALAVRRDGDHAFSELTSPPTSTSILAQGDLDRLLELLSWSRADLDPDIPVAVASAGEQHPVLAVRERSTLARLDYPFEPMRTLMRARRWTTLQLVHRATDGSFDARNPFPVGGVVEDPATGAAAAALGGMLRRFGLLPDDERFLVQQGDDMGRPSRLHVDARGADGDPVRVSGTCVPLTSADGVEQVVGGPSAAERCLEHYLATTDDPAAARRRFYEAFSVGDSRESRDHGARLIADGTKTATSELLWAYEEDGADPPTDGALSVVLDGGGRPVVVVESSEVRTIAFEDVDEAFAIAYGEWGGTLEQWRDGAWAYYAAQCRDLGREPSPRMPLVCEQLRVVHRCQPG